MEVASLGDRRDGLGLWGYSPHLKPAALKVLPPARIACPMLEVKPPVAGLRLADQSQSRAIGLSCFHDV